jgi:hypothetical protein
MEDLNEDFLTQDSAIPGQNYVCLSFVSPEKILEDKHLYYLWQFGKKEFKLVSSFKDFKEEFLNFEYGNKDNIEKAFYEKNDFHTTVRGLKVRGAYDTKKEATFRANSLRRQDASHHVFVGQVGFWLPWDPCADDIQEEDFLDSQLNNLMSKKKENELKKNMHFEEEKRQKLEHIQKENLRKKEENKRLEAEAAKAEAAADDTEVTVSEVQEDSGSGGGDENDNDDDEQPLKIEDDLPADSGLQETDPWLQRQQSRSEGGGGSKEDVEIEKNSFLNNVIEDLEKQ